MKIGIYGAFRVSVKNRIGMNQSRPNFDFDHVKFPFSDCQNTNSENEDEMPRTTDRILDVKRSINNAEICSRMSVRSFILAGDAGAVWHLF